MSKPLLLDLFCGAGGAAMGYHRAGFRVVGVDIKPQPHYPFMFIQADATKFPYKSKGAFALAGFDVIHASPPCQAYSVSTPDKSKHPDLAGRVREILAASMLPYVIENVPGAPLRDYVVLCGSSFGLRVRRHRLFETNFPLLAPPCNHRDQGTPVGVYGGGTGKGQKRGRKVMSSTEAVQVMGMPWATRKEVTQAIPPAYTEFIGSQLMVYLRGEQAKELLQGSGL